jgi:cyclopropane-fatty-acyl-phospholipid synthase
MFQSALDKMLRGLLREGDVAVQMPDGSLRKYGDGNGKPVTVRLLTRQIVARLATNPDLAFGEGYMDGAVTIDDDDLHGLLEVVARNLDGRRAAWWIRPAVWARIARRRFDQNNLISAARRNVAHHYDLSSTLYDLFLDQDRQYSCGYFLHPSDSLEQAQAQKKAHIAAKLLIRPGMRILDIGCGWGGLSLTLARDHGARVLGITLSHEQHRMATERAAREGLSDRVEFRLCDYRAVSGPFDRIVSVGMFEHVGLPHYRTYFERVRNLLTPDGVALIHTIGRPTPPDATNPWINKYIFPGGYIPAMSEVMRAIEKEDLWVADVECLRLHYAFTLRHWFDRFTANSDQLRRIYDERFLRMWRFYLVASEQTFRFARQDVFQFQLSRRIDAVPLTRDYLYHREEPAAARMLAE